MSNICCGRLPAAVVGVVVFAFACAVASPIAAQNQFDGNWTVNNASENCMVKRATWSLTVRNGAVSGGGGLPATGGISADGKSKWTRPAKADGLPVTYSGTFRGNEGSGIYKSAPPHPCSGRFTARRD